jgi:hypothetical protein
MSRPPLTLLARSDDVIGLECLLMTQSGHRNRVPALQTLNRESVETKRFCR